MRVKFRKGVTIHKLENKLTLFDGESSILYTLNESAAAILNGLRLGWNKTKTIKYLQENHSAGVNEAEEDYSNIQRFLKEKRLIEEK